MNLIKKILLLGILVLLGCPLAFCAHKIGNVMHYRYIGDGGWPNSKLFEVTLVEYERCWANNPYMAGIAYNPINISGGLTRTLQADTAFRFEYNRTECFNSNSSGCYEQIYYIDTISIRETDGLFYVFFANCCRTSIISNIFEPDSVSTLNYIDVTPAAYHLSNSSAQLIRRNFLRFCVGEPLEYNVEVLEPDGDQLVYKLCDVFGVRVGNGVSFDPPWPTVQYLLPTYATNYPLGQGGLSIDPITGQLSGTPQFVGEFTVGICVEEYRNGVYLSTVRQDIAISVVPCTPLLEANLSAETFDTGGRAVYQLCNENTLTLTNLSGPEEVVTSYEWYVDYPDQPLQSTDKHPTFIFDQPGVFQGHLVANPDSSCSDTVFFVVEVSDLATDYFSQYDTCDTGPVNLTAAPVSSAAITRYYWEFGDGGRVDTDADTVRHQFANAGNYPVQLVVENQYHCRDTLIRDLIWRPAPEVIVVSPDVAVGCTPLTTTIRDRSQPIDSTYELYWEFGDGAIGSGRAPQHVYSDTGNYTVYLSITSPLGCFVDTVFENLIIADARPEAAFSWSVAAEPENFTEVQFIDESQRALGLNWIFDTLSPPDFRSDPSYVFPDTGNHQVRLIVEDQYGCFDTLTQSIGIIPLQTYFLPNAFTPNGDGLNDQFVGIGLTDYLLDFKLEIFNRSGGVLFTSNNAAQGWDGTNAPAGVYLYQVSYRVPRGEQTMSRGEVVLMR